MTSKQILDTIEASFKPFYLGGIYIDGKNRNKGVIKGKPFSEMWQIIEKAAQENLLDTAGRDYDA